MLQRVLNLADRICHFPIAYAHCDIPCGIYNPDDALEAAKTMLKMTQKMLPLAEEKNPTEHNNYIRMAMVKEEHGRKCKHELLTLWTDYFKPEHLEKVPDLHEKVWMAAKQVSKVKQSVDEEAAKQLVEMVQEIADMFEKVEGAPKKE